MLSARRPVALAAYCVWLAVPTAASTVSTKRINSTGWPPPILTTRNGACLDKVSAKPSPVDRLISSGAIARAGRSLRPDRRYR